MINRTGLETPGLKVRGPVIARDRSVADFQLHPSYLTVAKRFPHAQKYLKQRVQLSLPKNEHLRKKALGELKRNLLGLNSDWARIFFRTFPLLRRITGADLLYPVVLFNYRDEYRGFLGRRGCSLPQIENSKAILWPFLIDVNCEGMDLMLLVTYRGSRRGLNTALIHEAVHNADLLCNLRATKDQLISEIAAFFAASGTRWVPELTPANMQMFNLHVAQFTDEERTYVNYSIKDIEGVGLSNWTPSPNPSDAAFALCRLLNFLTVLQEKGIPPEEIIREIFGCPNFEELRIAINKLQTKI